MPFTPAFRAGKHLNIVVSLFAVQGRDLFHRVKSAKVLMVGAGGIGCELLKDLLYTGFEHIEASTFAAQPSAWSRPYCLLPITRADD